ncbi:HD-GYP domain-containing protein [Sphingomonas sp. M1-B02]|uniref:HD-GYP domain-containing protein n=1 Tax=Sphingomonas sp. M1-B02 TaxID=3114300 RepID=UPI00223F46AE|nr:HD-GYP domain-containing protein [Sphingomonas sp. S6-11]UZK66144.1 HD-GYP domain-containing protein [Sphingomonas sp. S6-11]
MLVKVESKDLRTGMYVARIDGAWMNSPFWRNSFMLSDRRQIELLLEAGINAVVIDLEKGVGPEAPPPTLVEAAAPVLHNAGRERRARPRPFRTELDRAREIVEQSRSAVTRMFTDARLGRAVALDSALPIIDEIARSVERDASAMLKVTRLKTRNEYTYMHSVAVCALMINFARQLGLPESEVRDLGVAGLLHDIGKMATPLEVLEKPGSLTADELAQIRNHPIEGHALICESADVPAAALDVCLHHHERIDGGGYPFGLSGEQVSLHARMGAICDVYDAITSHRPYKDPWCPNQALATMLEWEGHFDPHLLHMFVVSIGIPPVGALVRLRSNRLAIVTGLREDGDPCRPEARAFYSVEGATFVDLEDLSTENPGEDIIRLEKGDYWFGERWPRVRDQVQAGESCA